MVLADLQHRRLFLFFFFLFGFLLPFLCFALFLCHSMVSVNVSQTSSFSSSTSSVLPFCFSSVFWWESHLSVSSVCRSVFVLVYYLSSALIATVVIWHFVAFSLTLYSILLHIVSIYSIFIVHLFAAHFLLFCWVIFTHFFFHHIHFNACTKILLDDVTSSSEAAVSRKVRAGRPVSRAVGWFAAGLFTPTLSPWCSAGAAVAGTLFNLQLQAPVMMVSAVSGKRGNEIALWTAR